MSEEIYDTEIAPALLKIAERCKEVGICFVASVEYEPGETGVTTSVAPKSAAQAFVVAAARSDGNVDAALISMVKRYGPGNSLFLRAGDLSDC